VDRLPVVPRPLIRALAIATVVGQAGIAVTGAVVRVTGSGLGCPTWPECFPGSLVPTPHPEVAALNQWIEFGNRLLTVVLVLAAGLTLLAVLTIRDRPRRLVWLAVAQPLGVVAQAVIGGFVVLSGLVWWSVAVHFLVSMVFTWLAVQLVVAVSAGRGPARPTAPGAVRGLAGQKPETPEDRAQTLAQAGSSFCPTVWKPPFTYALGSACCAPEVRSVATALSASRNGASGVRAASVFSLVAMSVSSSCSSLRCRSPEAVSPSARCTAPSVRIL